jgi:hypothetical protein
VGEKSKQIRQTKENLKKKGKKEPKISSSHKREKKRAKAPNKKKKKLTHIKVNRSIY